jgi:hypothetical protein
MDVFPEAAVKKMIFAVLLGSENRNPALRMRTSAGTTGIMSVSSDKIRPKNNNVIGHMARSVDTLPRRTP